jgi:hypothetical protein
VGCSMGGTAAHAVGYLEVKEGKKVKKLEEV